MLHGHAEWFVQCNALDLQAVDLMCVRVWAACMVRWISWKILPGSFGKIDKIASARNAISETPHDFLPKVQRQQFISNIQTSKAAHLREVDGASLYTCVTVNSNCLQYFSVTCAVFLECYHKPLHPPPRTQSIKKKRGAVVSKRVESTQLHCSHVKDRPYPWSRDLRLHIHINTYKIHPTLRNRHMCFGVDHRLQHSIKFPSRHQLKSLTRPPTHSEP